jgi:hypothetical protein
MTTNAKTVSSSDNATQKAAANAAVMNLAAPDGVGVDKIRELLFGNQMQDYDRRFAALEERFYQKLRELEAETARGQSGVEANIKKLLESLAGQLRDEKDVRSEGDKELERSLREQTQSLDKRLTKLSDQLAQLERDVADRMSHQLQTLHEEIKRRNDETRATLERMFSELGNVKTDRTLLAGLFVEIARCLNQDLTPKAKAGDRG